MTRRQPAGSSLLQLIGVDQDYLLSDMQYLKRTRPFLSLQMCNGFSFRDMGAILSAIILWNRRQRFPPGYCRPLF